jgi:outer membrane protein OmpA-like peptidoglycan-associated protein
MKMKTKLILKLRALVPQTVTTLIACLLVSIIVFTGTFAIAVAQTVQYERPSWKFGLTGAANVNFYQGTTQQLTNDFISPQAFNKGNGLGLFGGLTIEYYRPETLLGFMLQSGFDSRRGTFDQVTSPCNCPLDLTTELSYLTIEPSIRLAPFRSNLYIFGGPRFAFLLNKSFEFDQAVNSDFPNDADIINVTGDFGSMEKSQISMQIGAGLDIPISSSSNKTQYIISPYISYHPYMGQTPRSIETWNITTIRAGISLKFGNGKQITPIAAPVVLPPPPSINFTVDSPINTPVAISFVETFPLRNYVFFDKESTTIPARYTKLNKEQAANFTEDQLGRFNQVSVTGRSARQMTVYYNILNILGDRMVKNPSTSITLVGSSNTGLQNAKDKAEAVKTYLVSVFGINPSRITTLGQNKPTLASIQSGGTRELELLRQEDNRVTIESSSLLLLREYQTAPPLSVTVAQEAPLDSYVTFNVPGGSTMKSWKLEVRDENDRLQTFGPYYTERTSLSGKSILGDRERGTYKITMIGEANNGSIVRKETRADIVQWVTPVVEQGNRYSVIFEFDQSTVSAAYEKYLIDVVTPKITTGATVRIQGFSDTIGAPEYNLSLSEARAASVRTIIQSALTRLGRTDVTFDVKGHGDIISQSQFRNTLPEERFYNRTVVVDITPKR